ncbi:MAG: hypothetical protein ACRDQ0_04185 [Pseudonocardia sp.]
MAWTLEELQEAVQKPLGDPGPSRPLIVVHGLRDDGVHLVVDLNAGRSGGQGRRWQLAFPSIADDLTQMPLDHAALVVRANIEEWWDTRDQ